MVVAFVEVLFPAINPSVLVLVVFSVFAPMVWPVRFATVVLASVDDPETARLVRDARVAVMVLKSALVKVAKMPLKPVALEVPVSVDDAPLMVPMVAAPMFAFVAARLVEDAFVAKVLVEVLLVVVPFVATSAGVLIDEVAMSDPVILVPCKVVEASDADEVAVKVPRVAE